MEHICFKCTNVRKRTVGTFIETVCKYFPATKQQVQGNVSECECYQEKGKK